MQLEENELKEILQRWNTGQTITNEEMDILVNNKLIYNSNMITNLGCKLLESIDGIKRKI